MFASRRKEVRKQTRRDVPVCVLSAAKEQATQGTERPSISYRYRHEVIHAVVVMACQGGEASVGRGLQGENLACWWWLASLVGPPNKKIYTYTRARDVTQNITQKQEIDFKAPKRRF